MSTATWIWLAIFLVLCAGGAEGKDCSRGQMLYEQALQEGNILRKIPLLQESVAECKDYAAYLQLGRAYSQVAQEGPQEQADKLWVEAVEALQQAVSLAADDQARAAALSWLAQVYEARGQETDSIACLRQSYKLHPFPKVQEKLKDLEQKRLEQGMDAGYIKKALSSPVSRACFGVEPSLDIRINFAYDRAELTAQGREQVEELGRALTDPAFQGRSFNLIGHTDRHGTPEYNQGLSEKRALTVKNYLAQNFKLAVDHLRSEGKGKTALLYKGETPEDDALNRRVEVQLRP